MAYTWGIIFVFAVFQVAALFGLFYRRNDIADVVWGPGFFIAGLGALYGNPIDMSATEIFVFSLVGIWALRLSLFIGTRYYKKGREDTRYNNWRKQWGNTWLWRSYLQVFTLQPLILIVIALPILQVIAVGPQPLSMQVYVGAFIWLIGFLFETIGDHQLKVFSKDPKNKGKIMDRGLWSWTRHPNYFGEATLWWGIFVMTVSLETWWLVVSPLVVTFLVTQVSGVSMLEELMKDRPGFADYKKRTSVFFPLPPRS